LSSISTSLLIIGLPVNWIAADIVCLKDGILAEHWDVIQDEATEQQPKSGNPNVRRIIPEAKN
jgi:hypothetical protein